MDRMPVVFLLFYSIPESFLLLLFGLCAAKKEFKINMVCIYSITLALLSYAVRLFPVPFGIHSLVGLLAIYFVFKYSFQLNSNESLLVTLLSCGTLLALEITIGFLIYMNLGMSLKEVWHQEPWMRTFLAWPHLAAFGLFTYLVCKKRGSK